MNVTLSVVRIQVHVGMSRCGSSACACQDAVQGFDIIDSAGTRWR